MQSHLPLTQLENWRWVQGWHMNARRVLFGGDLLSWVDEDATMLAHRLSNDGIFTTVGMDRVSFRKPVEAGERLHFHYELAHVGKKSVTIQANVRILQCDVDGNGKEFDETEGPVFSALVTLASINGFGEAVPVDLARSVQERLDVLRSRPSWRLVEKIRSERKTDVQS